MQVYLLDKKKITKLILPNEIDGAYAMEYKPESATVKRQVNVEANDGKWILKSNGEVNAIRDGMILSGLELNEYNYYELKVLGLEEYLGLFCMPTTELNYSKVLINTESFSVGKKADSGICYQEDLIQDYHISFLKEDNKWFVSCPKDNPKCIAYLNDVIITKKQLKTGDIIFAYGLRIIWLNNFMLVYYPKGKAILSNLIIPNYIEESIDNSQYSPINEEEESIQLYKAGDYFFHTPRMKVKIEPKTLKIDPPPANQVQEELPLILSMGSSITMLASAFMSGYSLLYSIQNKTKTMSQLIPSIVMFSALVLGSLLMPRITRWYQSNRRKKKEKLRQKKYTEYLRVNVNKINTIIAEQTKILQENNPSLGEVNGIAHSNSRAKWSKEIKDSDFLEIRVGTGNVPAELNIIAPEEQFTLEEDNLMNMVIDIASQDYKLENVPIKFSFLENKTSAVICSATWEQDYINGLVLQLATFHSAADLKMVFLINDPNIDKWRYTKFLPHTLSDDKKTRFFADNPNEYKSVCAHLEEEFNRRRSSISDDEEEIKEVHHKDFYKNYNTYYLIITNDYLSIKNIPFIDKVLNSFQNLGFSFLVFENALHKLPNQCSTFLQVMDTESCIISKDLNYQTRFTAEHDNNISMRSVSTQLANIPLLTSSVIASLPQSLTFLEMYNVSKIEQLNIANRWKENNPTESLQAQIGVQTSGDQFYLDLHEKYHGPHGLIAGSTGSGKSEFIITYILSMALNYHPDEVQFVIIDYKGGGLAGAFENRSTGMKLPHLVGTITNLDTSEMNRTLVSINSEIKKRQQKFNEAKEETGESTIDIYKYQKFYREGLVKEPISHLFIISDEFAELKSQQPEFMDEIISTARIGRSLGVHLILATQKPTGVVNDQIWSNSKFKVCLKVQNRSDSMEMLKKPDAASIKEPGRFYLQVGYDEYYDIGQSGWAGAKYQPTDRIIKKVDDSINFINNTGYIYKTANDLVKKEVVQENGDQLTNMVKYIINVAEKENFKPKQLWRNIIPAEIFLNNLREKYKYSREPYIINPPIGEYDNPSAQYQGLLTLDISNRGNTLIYGKTGSGKENLLSTIIFSTISDHHPSEVNFYIIDMGAETLRIYERMPHVGDVCLMNDGEKIYQLLLLIDKEIDRRKELFVEYNGNYNDYIKNSGKTEPSIIVVINNYEVFTEMHAKYAELITSFYRDCNKYGIYFIVTMNISSTMRQRITDLFPNKLCLQMPNDSDYRNLLGSPKNLVPQKIFGRGIVSLVNGQYEFQTAYIYLKNEINNIIKQAATAYSKYNYKAKRIPVLPEVVTYRIIQNYMKDITKVPIGFDGYSKEEFFYNFAKNNVNVICSNDIEPNLPFFYALLNLMKKDHNLNIRVLDILNILDQKRFGIESFKNNFDQVIANLAKEIANEANSSKMNVYLFVGIGELKGLLTENGKNIYNEIFSNADKYKKTKFILTDSYNSYKKFQTETWYNTIIDSNTGIWLGGGVGNQFAISFPSLSMEEKNFELPDIAFVVNKGTHSIVKKMVLTQEEDINE